jgi:hypothetical protein
MDSMFLEAESFNQPIGTWGTSRVKSMDRMFYDARSFDMPLGSWDIPMAESYLPEWMTLKARTLDTSV